METLNVILQYLNLPYTMIIVLGVEAIKIYLPKIGLYIKDKFVTLIFSVVVAGFFVVFSEIDLVTLLISFLFAQQGYDIIVKPLKSRFA